MDHEPADSNWFKEQVPGTCHGESAEQPASAPGKGVGAAKYVASVDEEVSARITSPQFQSCNVDSNLNGGIMMKILAGERNPSEPYVFSRRSFIAKTSCFGAFYAVTELIPLPALAAELSSYSPASPTPILDHC